MTRRDPTFRELARRARGLTVVVILAAALGALMTAPAEPVGSAELTLLVLVAALCLVASFVEVSRPGSSSLHPGLVFVFWAAVSLPPATLPALAAVCFVPSVLRGRVRWYVPAFQGAACVLAGLAVHLLVAGHSLTGSGGALALGAAALAFVLAVDALMALHMRLAWHRPLRVAARGLATHAPVDIALTTTGAALAALWSYDPWLCAILTGPLALVTRAMLVPALRHKSRTDPKTRLYNFEYLREALDDTLRAAARRDENVALVMIDLDHLRVINNRFGHLAGDQGILRVAEALARAAHDRGIAARFGGEEFCLLLPDWTGRHAEALMEGVRDAVHDLSWGAEGDTMHCSFSAGIAVFPKDAEDAQGLLNAADAALYDAKAGGRNRTRLALPPGDLESVVAPPAATPAPLPAIPVAPVECVDAAAAPLLAPEDEPEEAPEDEPPGRRHIPTLIAVLLAAVIAVLVVSGPIGQGDPVVLLLLLVAAVVLLDIVRIDLFEGLNLSAASVPTLTLACVFGPVGPIAAELAIAVLRLGRGEPRLKWSFDFGALSLAGTAAAVVFATMPTDTPLQAIFAGIPAALAYYVVNMTLMSVVIGMAEGRRPLAVWREGMAWLWTHFVIYGLLGASLAVSYEQIGLIATLLFALPVVALWIGQRVYVHRSRASLVELRRHRDDLEIANRRLQRLLDEKRDLVGRVHASYLATITTLARTIEAKDPYTGGHVERVAKVTLLLAEELGLSETERRAAEVGATIHDIGKVGVPDAILLKDSSLSEDECSIMRRHPETSSYIVGELDVPRIVKEMVRSHHERYDGGGYPDGLAGEEIPLSARILAVADTLDAITSDRPYRPARSLRVAIGEIEALSGQQFCPSVVAALDACLARDATLGGLFEPRRFPAAGVAALSA